MSSNVSIAVQSLSKCYHIYDKPRDRLKQMLAAGRKQFFREFWALQDVSFTIHRGETVGIIGRNGSGKSTLLQIICGTVTPTAGTVHTHGRVAALLELGAGFNPEFTGRENILLNATVLGFPQEEMKARMDDVLAFSELGDFLDQPVKTYSSGMYSRLAFSIAIHVDPDILIVDEALAVGDARFVAKCMRRIKDIQEQGVTILFVSHDVSSVRTLCGSALWLDKGRLVDEGDVFPVTSRFMEFMFRDENESPLTANDSNHKNDTHADILPPKNIEPQEPGSTPEWIDAQTSLQRQDESLDSRPVTHWGSHKGLILSAGVCTEHAQRKDIHAWGDTLKIVIDVNIPATISREHLSVAVSIKDLKGTDLIVSTTHDLNIGSLPETEQFSVEFELVNALTTGKYLLVAAIENRQHHDIHYYEYVEGAHYFSSVSDKRFFGLFQPKMQQHIRVKK